MLPDDVLIEIFDFYVDEHMDDEYEKKLTEEWITLAHVCRRWRSVVFQSPRRLNLRLVCSPLTHARDTLDIWPPLPLIIRVRAEPSRVEDIIAALEYNERVCQIDLIDLTSPQLENVTGSAAMQKSFPELTFLQLSNINISMWEYDEPEIILPDSFLGGTAPRLRSLYLIYVPFPGLPKLLLSATHLVHLDLVGIPPSGYILPEAMATCLSMLNSLESLHLRFLSPRPRPALGSRPPPLSPRSILPCLTKIRFKGVSEYLEEILARIDAPRVNEMRITFFNQIIFNTPQLFRFISRRSSWSTQGQPERGHIEFSSEAVTVKFLSQPSDCGVLSVGIICTASEWQLPSLEQVCTSSLPPASTLEDLYIFEYRGTPPRWQDDIESTLWLDLLRSFAAVKNLYLSEEYVPHIAHALQELVGGRTAEILPNLENIFLDKFRPLGPLHEDIEKFIAARRLASHPVAVSGWDTDRDREIYDW